MFSAERGRRGEGHALLGQLPSQQVARSFSNSLWGRRGGPSRRSSVGECRWGPAPSPSRPVPTASKRDCFERFGPQTLERITRDDHVICSTEYSRIVPLENGEVGSGAARWPVPAGLVVAAHTLA